jgi:hypothetical protein
MHLLIFFSSIHLHHAHRIPFPCYRIKLFARDSLGLGFLLAGIIVIFRTHRHFQGLSWLQSILWISTSTIIFFIAFILVVALYISTNKHIGGIFFYIVILLYGFALIFVAYKKPPLSQQISESVRNILETMPSKQISEYELFIYLQRKYQISEELLHQYLNGLSYIEQMDIPGTSAKVYRMKGIKEQLVFPQVTKITNPILRGNVERALSDLTEERVDIGLFLLGREFETTLKAFLLAAYAKGKLTSTPGNKKPDKLTLVEMISCLKSNGIITDDAVLSYLRQTRNDRAHGGTPTPAERHLLMQNVQLLASLYIDYIKMLDDYNQAL